MKNGYHLFLVLVIFIFLPDFARANTPGTMRYNDRIHNYEFFDGGEWYQFSTVIMPLKSCSDEGAMQYNNLLDIYEICTGSTVKKTAGLVTLSLCSRPGVIDYRHNRFMYCNGLVWVSLKGFLVSEN